MIFVFPTALDHSAAEILELVGNAICDNKRQRIGRRHLHFAILNEE